MEHLIKRLMVHCSDSEFGDKSFIHDIHVNQKKWRDIGYQYIIYNTFPKPDMIRVPGNDGLIVQGRPIDANSTLNSKEVGAHTYGFNRESIGICLIGVKEFTDAQFYSLMAIYNYWKRIIPGIEMNGHYEFCNTKTCPNFNVPNFKRKVDRLLEIDPILHGIGKF